MGWCPSSRASTQHQPVPPAPLEQSEGVWEPCWKHSHKTQIWGPPRRDTVPIWRLWGILPSQPHLPFQLSGSLSGMASTTCGVKDKKRAPHQRRAVGLAVATSCHQHEQRHQHPRGEGSDGTAREQLLQSKSQNLSQQWSSWMVFQHHRAPEGRLQSQGAAPIPNGSRLASAIPILPEGSSSSAAFGNVFSSSTGTRDYGKIVNPSIPQGCNHLFLMMLLWNICSAFCHCQSGSRGAPAQPHKQDFTLPGWNSAFDQALGDSSTPGAPTELHREGPNWKI